MFRFPVHLVFYCAVAVSEMRSDLPKQGERGGGGQGHRIPDVRLSERVRYVQQPARVRGIKTREWLRSVQKSQHKSYMHDYYC